MVLRSRGTTQEEIEVSILPQIKSIPSRKRFAPQTVQRDERSSAYANNGNKKHDGHSNVPDLESKK